MEYNPGIWKTIKRSVTPNLSSTSQSSNKQPSKWLKFKTLISFVVFPGLIIAMDMFYSDTMAMYRLKNYIDTFLQERNTTIPETENTSSSLNNYNNEGLGSILRSSHIILFVWWFLLAFIYFVSFVNILTSNGIRRYQISFSSRFLMVDVYEEISATPIPLGKTNNFDHKSPLEIPFLRARSILLENMI